MCVCVCKCIRGVNECMQECVVYVRGVEERLSSSVGLNVCVGMSVYEREGRRQTV